MALSNGFLIPGGLENSKEFSEAIHALVGNGVCKHGGQYGLTFGGGFKVKLSTGYAVANGRYVEHDEPFTLTFPASGNNSDRYDAIAARVDYLARKTEIVILVDIDPGNPVRNDEEYNLILYQLRIRRGATVFQDSDLLDVRGNSNLCGYIIPLSDISGKIEYVYSFISSGVDKTIAELQERISEIIKSLTEKVQSLPGKADAELEKLDARVESIEGKSIGDMETSRLPLSPSNEWLLCDGTAVPAQYPELSEILSGNLPNISRMDDRYRTYIYGGVPVEV